MEKAADAHQLYWDLGGGVSEDDLTSTGLTTDEFAGMIFREPGTYEGGKLGQKSGVG